MSDILLRPNARTAGRTFHTARFDQLPTTSPVIYQSIQQPPSKRLQQTSQMNAELEQRRSTAVKRKEETAMHHRGKVFNNPNQLSHNKY